MKVIILAGGWGSRLGALSETIPKPMVSIGSKPILWHIMKIYSYYGFKDFIVATGVKSEVIKNYFLNFNMINSDFTVDLGKNDIKILNKSIIEDWRVTLVDTGLNTLKGARIKRLERFIDDDNFMLTYGDGLCDININDLIKFHKEHGKKLTITGVNPPARFGEIIHDKGLITNFSEKPQTSSGLINGGYMVANVDLLNYLTNNEDCDFETEVIEKLVKLKQVMVYKNQGKWGCMDHERDVHHLNKQWASGNAFWKVW